MKFIEWVGMVIAGILGFVLMAALSIGIPIAILYGVFLVLQHFGILEMLQQMVN